jgi:hypothetical protein
MKKTLFILLTFYCSSLFSQTQNLTLGLNYPILIGNNFIKKNYTGIIDAEVKYFPYKLKKLKLGITTDIGVLTNNDDFISKSSIDKPNLTHITILFIKPGLNAEMEFGRFVPYAGVGYSFFNFMSKNAPANEDSSSDGLNLNFGLKFNLFQHIFLNTNFDYTRFRLEGEALNISYNRDIYSLKAGVGYRF